MGAPAKLKQLAPLLKKPSFTSKEARKAGVHPALLSHYAKTGRLERLREGVYRSPESPVPTSMQRADLIEAVLSIPNGAICLTSALAIYGLTEEIPRHHWIAISHSTSIKAPRPIKIVRYRNTDLGRTETDLDGIRVPIYDRERTIIDAFRQLSRETAIKALKMALSAQSSERINLVKLQLYAKKLRVPIEPYLLAVTT